MRTLGISTASVILRRGFQPVVFPRSFNKFNASIFYLISLVSIALWLCPPSGPGLALDRTLRTGNLGLNMIRVAVRCHARVIPGGQPPTPGMNKMAIHLNCVVKAPAL